MKIIKDEWTGCYPSSWKGVIVPEAMAHPAKYSSKLIRRIYEHLFQEGWVKPSDNVIDPFGGVALGALDAMRLGLNWYGVELEAKFAGLGNQNIDKWLSQFGTMPRWGSAHLFNGDSRNLLEVINTQAQVAVSSPPYGVEALGHAGEPNEIDKAKRLNSRIAGNSYGGTSGQLGEMRSDSFDAAVSSPPFTGSQQVDNRTKPSTAMSHTWQKRFGDITDGTSPDQLANVSEDDFWLAARTIVEQVYQALTPGGHACWVVKDYVKNKQIVPFGDQWRQLCEAVGFVTIHEHHAMLVHHKGTQHTLEGGTVERKTESKSFFRRLAEKNGSPRIDWETVYCMVKL